MDLIGRLLIAPQKEILLSVHALNEEEEEEEVASMLPRTKSIVPMLCDTQVIMTCCCIMVSAAVFSGIEPTLPLYLKETFQQSPTSIGMLYSAVILPSLVFSTLTGMLSDRIGRKNVMALGSFSFSIGCCAVAMAHSIPSK